MPIITAVFRVNIQRMLIFLIVIYFFIFFYFVTLNPWINFNFFFAVLDYIYLIG